MDPEIQSKVLSEVDNDGRSKFLNADVDKQKQPLPAFFVVVF